MQSFYANTKFAAYGAGQVPALQPQQPANPATQQRMQEYRSQVDTLHNLLQEQREDEQQRRQERRAL